MQLSRRIVIGILPTLFTLGCSTHDMSDASAGALASEKSSAPPGMQYLRAETVRNGCGSNNHLAYVENVNSFPVNIAVCKNSIAPGGNKTRRFLKYPLGTGERADLGCTRTGTEIHGYSVHWQARSHQSIPQNLSDAKQALKIEIISGHEYIHNYNLKKAIRVDYQKGSRRDMAVIDKHDRHLVLPYPGELSILSAAYTPIGYPKADCS